MLQGHVEAHFDQYDRVVNVSEAQTYSCAASVKGCLSWNKVVLGGKETEL